MNLDITIPYSFDIFNNKDELMKNNKVLDYIKMLINIDQKIGNLIDYSIRLDIFHTKITYDNIDNKVLLLDDIIVTLIKKYKNKEEYTNIMFCYRYIIDFKMFYDNNDNKLIRSKL